MPYALALSRRKSRVPSVMLLRVVDAITPPPLRRNLSHHAIAMRGGTESRKSQLLGRLVGVSTEKSEVTGYNDG
eukprot:1090130-Rhodomonas_salina.3